LTDRGMYSPRLFRCLLRLHWHPFLRIRAQGFYRPLGSQKWLKLEELHPVDGQAEAVAAEVFKNDGGRLACTLVAYHGAGHAEAWLIVTDLAVTVARASWYGLRGWIEQGYKRLKGEGWHLPRTRITAGGRLERLWLAVAVATLWVLEVGGEAETAEPAEPPRPPEGKRAGADTPELPDLGPSDPEGAKAVDGAGAPQRIWSVFGRGWNVLRNALAVGLLVLGSWHPEAWPDQPAQGLPPTPAAGARTAQGAATQALAQPDRGSIPIIHKCDSS
jgi:hypothetical protein